MFNNKDTRGSRGKGNNMDSDRHNERGELDSRGGHRRDNKKRLEPNEKYTRHENDGDDSYHRGSRRYDSSNSSEDRNKRDEKRSIKHESESYYKADRDGRVDRRSGHNSSYRRSSD